MQDEEFYFEGSSWDDCDHQNTIRNKILLQVPASIHVPEVGPTMWKIQEQVCLIREMASEASNLWVSSIIPIGSSDFSWSCNLSNWGFMQRVSSAMVLGRKYGQPPWAHLPTQGGLDWNINWLDFVTSPNLSTLNFPCKGWGISCIFVVLLSSPLVWKAWEFDKDW